MLNIEQKEDTPEKLEAVQGLPTKNFIFASEFNAMKNFINALFNARQNSLAPDGTGTKYPTVDAVNSALANISPGPAIATQSENEGAASATELNIPNINNTKASSPRGLRWFWNAVRVIDWDWQGKPTFWASAKFGNLTSGHWLRLNSNKDVEGFDGVALLNGKLDKGILDRRALTSFTTNVNSGELHNRTVIIEVSGVSRNITTASGYGAIMFIRKNPLNGSSPHNFIAGAGRTLELANNISVMNGRNNSTALLVEDGLVDILYITNL
jgi:hypothetical protein